MEGKFKIGDKFVRKLTRDSFVMRIESVSHNIGQEPTYELKPIYGYGKEQMIGEEALEELYYKVD